MATSRVGPGYLRQVVLADCSGLRRLHRAAPPPARDLRVPVGPAVSRHVAVLRRAGLIHQRVDSQRRPCRLDSTALAELAN